MDKQTGHKLCALTYRCRAEKSYCKLLKAFKKHFRKRINMFLKTSFKLRVSIILLSANALTFSQTNPCFFHVSTSLLKTVEKEKLLIMSNFSFSHSVSYCFFHNLKLSSAISLSLEESFGTE